MNIKTAPNTASEWIVALQETPDDTSLRRRFDDWLAHDEANKHDWDETLAVWRDLGMTLPAHADLWSAPIDETRSAAHPRPQRPIPRRAPQKGRRRFQSRHSVWAFGIAAALVAAVLLPGRWDAIQSDYVTATGETKIVDLPDGSRVTLAPESMVDLAFEDGRRQLVLREGTAFFDVAPDPTRPFIVESGPITTTVLGTAFNVALLEGDVAVTVQHGKVRVDGQDGTANSLIPGDTLTLTQDGVLEKGRATVADIAAWRDGQLIVKDESVDDVAKALDRYFTGWIVVSDASLAGQPLTGVYNLSNPKSALSAIANTHKAKVYEISPWLLVLTTD